MTWHALGSAVCKLGESPFWQAQENRLYWVDIDGQALLRADWASGSTERWPMRSEPGCFAPATTAGAPSGWVMALRNGIYRAQQWGGELTCIARLPYDPAVHRANDGKCDPQGRMWVGTRDEQSGSTAAMYCIEAADDRARVRRWWNQAGTLNGLAWSPDARTLYSADTPTHRIEQRPWNAVTGEPGVARTFHAFAAKPEGWTPAEGRRDDVRRDGLRDGGRPYGGRPDGAAVDVDGNYWCALYEGGRVVQLSPTGALLQEIAVPAMCPTMVCLGGPQLRTLCVTTASRGRAADELARTPLAGQVLVLDAPVQVPGLPVNHFQETVPLAALAQ